MEATLWMETELTRAKKRHKARGTLLTQNRDAPSLHVDDIEDWDALDLSVAEAGLLKKRLLRAACSVHYTAKGTRPENPTPLHLTGVFEGPDLHAFLGGSALSLSDLTRAARYKCAAVCIMALTALETLPSPRGVLVAHCDMTDRRGRIPPTEVSDSDLRCLT